MALVKSLFHFTKSEISQFLKKAKRILRSPTLDILAHPQAKEHGRLLILTPKRIGNAVERNKIRRRLKSIFYEEKLFEQPYDYGIISKKPLLRLNFKELKELLTSQLKEYKR